LSPRAAPEAPSLRLVTTLLRADWIPPAVRTVHNPVMAVTGMVPGLNPGFPSHWHQLRIRFV